MSTQSVLLAALLALTVPVSAQLSSNLPPQIGALTPGPGDAGAPAQQALEIAGRNPNATSSVTFNRTDYNNFGSWVWRVNVTDVPIPNSFNDLGLSTANSSQGYHLVNTQWDLQWPGNNESLQSFLGTTNSSIRVNALQISFPSNVTSSYNDQTNGNCAVLFGNKCTQSLMELATSQGGSAFDYSGLEGCASTLNVGDVTAGTGFVISFNDTVSNNSTLQPGGTLFSSTSSAFKTDNLTFFHDAESFVNLLTLDFTTQPRSHGTGSNGGPSVLCQIVDKTADSAAAAGWHQTTPARLWTMFLLGTLVLSLQ